MRKSWLFIFFIFFLTAGVNVQAAQDAVSITTRWSDQTKSADSNAPYSAALEPGAQSAIAIILHIKPGFHVNPSKAQLPDDLAFMPIATKVSLANNDKNLALQIGKPQYPEPSFRDVEYAKKPLPVFENKVVIYLPVIVKDGAKAGKVNLDLKIKYQSCNDKVCLRPQTVTKHLIVNITSKPSNAKIDSSVASNKFSSANSSNLFDNFDSSVFASMQSGKNFTVDSNSPINHDANSIIKNDFFGFNFTLDSSSGIGLILILLVALVAGFLLNFTPCVLPVVPLKIMSLQQHSGNSASRLKNGAVFCLGIVVTFAFLGGLVGGLLVGIGTFQWGSIFSYAPVSIILAVIIVIMALGMLDLFTFRLPNWVYAIRPTQEKLSGNFLFGILTAVLSTPCTGPLLGATIVWAVKQSAFLAIGSFVVMGIGMALPYALLIANPKWLEKLPRAGEGSQLLKQILALLLLAVATFFLSPVVPGNMVWWIIAGFVALAMVWMAYRTFNISSKLLPRVASTILAILLISGSASAAWMLTRPGPIPWQPYSKQAFKQAKQNNKTVLVEFTADWCGNCKALELTVYRNPKLAAIFQNDSFKAFQIDLTSSANKKGWMLQRKLAPGAGIPLAAVYKEHKSKPIAVFQGLFTAGELIRALES